MQIGVKEHLHTYGSCFPSSGLGFKAIANNEKRKPQWMSAIIVPLIKSQGSFCLFEQT